MGNGWWLIWPAVLLRVERSEIRSSTAGRDNVQPLGFRQLQAALEPLLKSADGDLHLDIEPSPLASASAADFQVAGFVFELFQIQRRHGIYGSPDFTLPILSLLTYEGMIKDIYPEIDFLQEAVPFEMASLAVRA